MKHYRLLGSNGEQPALLVEARLNVHDVRSGYSDSRLVLISGPILEESDLGWTPDMVAHHQWDEIEEVGAGRDIRVSDGADNKALDFVLRYCPVSIWYHPTLRIYSKTGESRQDFARRCLEASAEGHAETLKKAQDVYLHRFLELEQKALEGVRSEEWAPEVLDQKLAAIRDTFSEVREGLSRIFPKRGLSPMTDEPLEWGRGLPIDVGERLEDLKKDFLRRYAQLHEEVVEQAGPIEEYSVPVSYAEVAIELKAVLWK